VPLGVGEPRGFADQKRRHEVPPELSWQRHGAGRDAPTRLAPVQEPGRTAPCARSPCAREAPKTCRESRTLRRKVSETAVAGTSPDLVPDGQRLHNQGDRRRRWSFRQDAEETGAAFPIVTDREGVAIKKKNAVLRFDKD